jgi:hypothetical protein
MFISAQLFNPAHWFKLAHVHSGALVQTAAHKKFSFL